MTSHSKENTSVQPLTSGYKAIDASRKLDTVCYEIRGPVMDESHRLEEEGHQIIKLNIGNPAPFGFQTPDQITRDVIHYLPDSQGYGNSKGLLSARRAIMQRCENDDILNVDVEDIYIGNGVSELIGMAIQGLVNANDEILIPAPDYPLWTAVTTLSGGRAVHYHLDFTNDWLPDIDDIKSKITAKTRAILLINPNNPTGSVYPKEVLEAILDVARKHGLIIFSDEIYDRILFDGQKHIPIASLCDDVPIITFGGLSKNHRAAGYRVGWMILSGPKTLTKGYREGLNLLASMRLCPNVPSQHGVSTALGGIQSIDALVAPNGRLAKQRDYAHERLSSIKGVKCIKPKGALYLFPQLDPKVYPIHDDEQFVLSLLREEKVQIVQGSGFSLNSTQFFRVVFLPPLHKLEVAFDRIEHFLQRQRKQKP